MLQQLGGLWRRLREQGPVQQAAILAAPVVVAALLVLGGLMIWSASQPSISSRAAAVAAQAAGAATTATVVATAVPVAATATVPVSAPAVAVAASPTVAVPTREPTLPPTLTPTPEPTSTPTPTPAPARSARIVNTDGQGANMRRAPSVSAQRVRVLAEGTVVELVGGEQRGDGYTWRNVRDVDGSAGFVTVEYLQPIQAPPGATPVLPPPPIQVDEITSPVGRGAPATLKIITRPGVRCELRVLVFGPETQPSDGLELTMADADGVCAWTWTVPQEVVPGTWRYRIVAGEGASRSTREVPFVIT